MRQKELSFIIDRYVYSSFWGIGAYYLNLTELIEIKYSLPYFEFIYDEHWDLVHGWLSDIK